MEVKQVEMTQEVWDEWSALIRDQECAVCGGQLTIHTVPARAAMALGCPNTQHAGFRQRTSYTEDYRRGRDVYLPIRDNIEAKMMVKTELNRAMNLLGMRFPDAIKDVAGAALFINDCNRLGLDPLIQPGEAVPIPFRTKDKAGREKITVAMIVTEDGYLSMAARGCPDEYDGAPATMPLLDYLMREHPQRPLEELEKMSKRTAEELCDDPAAFVWVALGKRRSATDVNPVYGYYRQAEWKKAKDKGLPAGTQPGNQARVRAVKRWVRENFAECRQKMLEYTRELTQRTGGIPELQEFIDAEYTIITGPIDKKPHLISPPGGQKAAAATKAARTKVAEQAENKVVEPAKRSPEAVEQTLAGPSGADEKTLFSASESPEMAITREASAAAEGFSINLQWLKEAMQMLKWGDETMLTWLTSQYKVSGNTVPEALKMLTREQTEEFTRKINTRLEKQGAFFRA